MHGLFVFLLIAMFAVFSLMLVLIGMRAYRGTVDISTSNAQVRTGLSYICNRVRAAEGTVWVRDEQGVPVLVLGQDIEGELYETRIFFLPGEDGAKGTLREQFVSAEEPFDTDSSEMITDARNVEIAQQDGLVRVVVTTDNGRIATAFARPRPASPIAP